MKKNGNIKTWDIGDCFIKKIKSEDYPLYNNKYLIIIVSGFYEYEENKIYPNVYIKISDKPINNIDDINNSEFVVVNEVHWSMRNLPLLGGLTHEEFIQLRSSVELFPDEYGFLKEYQLCVSPSKFNRTYLNNTEYIIIDFSKLKKPNDEFLHWQDGLENDFQSVIFEENKVDNKIIRLYRRFNLRKWCYYQIPLEDMQVAKNGLRIIYEKYNDFLESYDEDIDNTKNE